jgi:hypothetical protein
MLVEKLCYAIQDQHFDIGSYDRDNGSLELNKTDAGFVVDRYLEACETGEWTKPCLDDRSPAVVAVLMSPTVAVFQADTALQ